MIKIFLYLGYIYQTAAENRAIIRAGIKSGSKMDTGAEHDDSQDRQYTEIIDGQAVTVKVFLSPTVKSLEWPIYPKGEPIWPKVKGCLRVPKLGGT